MTSETGEKLQAPVLEIPDFCLVALIGASGCGKSTFAARHFLPTEILSSDGFRAWVSDDETSLDATDDAFDALYHLARLRLKRRKLVVVDATNVQPHARKNLLDLANEYDTMAVAVVLNVPERVCQDRNKERPNRDFGPHVVRNQIRALKDTLRSIRREGFRHVFVLETQEQIDNCRFERRPLWTDRRNEHGPFDIIGDVHGCSEELSELLTLLGYGPGDGGAWSHPEGRRAIFLGDLVDRGPGVVEVVRLVQSMVAAGTALCVPGNHDVKLMRALQGRNVKVAHGLQESLDQIEALPEGEREEFKRAYVEFVDRLVSHFVLADGRLVVAHAGMKEAYQGRASRRVRDFALYGDTTGETDEFGLPVRYPWAEDYRGAATVVYGHTPVPEAEWLNRTINIDTGCVFGGKLTALRWPERELVQVPSKRQYAVPAKPFLAVTTADDRRLTEDGPRQAPEEGSSGDTALLSSLREALDATAQLRKLVETEERLIASLRSKQNLASLEGMQELAHIIEGEIASRQETIDQVRASRDQAESMEAMLRARLEEMGPPSPVEFGKREQDPVTRVEELLPKLREIAQSLAENEVSATAGLDVPNGATTDEALDNAVRRMKEAQIRNRELAVKAITAKNNLYAMIDRERRTVHRLENEIAEALARGETPEVERLREQQSTSSAAVQKMEPLLQQAEEISEQVKQAIRAEDEAIRAATADALRKKTIARTTELLAQIRRTVEEVERARAADSLSESSLPNAQRSTLQLQHDEVLRAEDVLGKRFVPTTLMGNVTVRAENAAAALEVMSRFAVEPRWLIYLPPTMSPSETTEEPGYLEYPREAFEYFRKNGVERVVCQTKHMGSRAVVVVCRNEEAALRRFGATGSLGVCYTRTGRQFFDDDTLHAAVVREVADAVGRAALWEELQTDWLCLDAELMPWNAKAQSLLREQYAPVGAAARLSLEAAVASVRKSAERGLPLGDLVSRLEQRREDVERYVEAYGRYCWETNGLQDLKLAPFHLLASEGRTYFDRNHEWHVSTLAKLAGASGLFLATDSRTVNLGDEGSVEAATDWWLDYTGAGGEGMVVKPLQFIARGWKGPIQPAVKVRGRDYLRIIYGPEYTEQENLERLRKRGLHSKRALAIREFALGVEALERFVRREPLRLVHECVFAILALESEPIDPRL